MIIDKVMAEKMHKVIADAVSEAIERHRRLGESIAISENGVVKILSPEDILERQKKNKKS